jgi:dienelactone hydrolase
MRSLGVFLVGMVVLGACSAPPQEEQSLPESTPAPEAGPDIRGEEVAYESGGVQLNGYLAYDAAQSGERPGVLVVHEWWGHNNYARQRARMLAEMGYTALAVDMYGDGKFAEHPEDAQKFMMEVMSQLDVGVERFRAARGMLEGHSTTDDSRTAAIGYLAGVASFHGNLASQVEAEPGSIQAKVLVLNGADDPFVSAESIEAFKGEMEGLGADMTFINYTGAVHSFTNPGATALGEQFEMPLAYQREADEESWAELDAFLAEIFGS